jgi:hypothetical protein
MVRGVARDRVKARRQGGFAVVGAAGLVAADRRSRVAGDSDELSLTVLLRRHLFEVKTDGTTRAQQLVEAWFDKALEGDYRARQELVIRIDGEAKSREEEAAETVAMPEYPEVDELTAQKILDVFNDHRDTLPGD